jgi:hypothetical protein
MRNLVTSYESERLENAEREHQTRLRLTTELEQTRAQAKEREDDLIDIIWELQQGLVEALPFAEDECDLPLRTFIARAEDLFRRSGVTPWTG